MQVDTTSYTQRRHDIDGLRAIAVAVVVLFHTFPEWVPGGYVGVEVFFVISGYLITGLMLRALQDKHFNFLDFYLKRARRIFPTLAVTLASTLLAGLIFLLSDELNELTNETTWGVFFSANFYFWHTAQEYFKPEGSFNPLMHLWSLGVEEQFYLVWPLLVWWSYRFRQLGLMLFLTVGSSFLWGICVVADDPIAGFFSPAARVWQLGLGATIAWLEKMHPDIFNGHSQNTNKNTQYATAWLGIFCIIFPTFYYDSSIVYPGINALLPIMGAMLVVISGSNKGVSQSLPLLSSGPMVWLGSISYALYLWHWPILSYARLIYDPLPNWVAAACLAGMIGLSWLSVHKMEEPLRLNFPLRKAGVVGCLMLVAVLCLNGLAHLMAQQPWRTPVARSQNVSDLRENQKQLGWFKSSAPCVHYFGLEAEQAVAKEALFCSWPDTRQNQNNQVLIFGDSTANHLYPGIQKLLSPLNIDVVNVGNGTCSPFTGQDGTFAYNKPCRAVNEKLYTHIRTHPEIKTIILGFAAWDIMNMRIDGVGPNPDVATRFAAMAAQARKDLAPLIESGRRVVVLTGSPNIHMDPRNCLQRLNSCTTPRPQGSPSQPDFEHLWADTLGQIKGVCVLNVANLFDDGSGHWKVVENRRLLFRDDHHLSYVGSEKVAQALMQSPCRVVAP